ncbi:MAG: ion transporter [Alphaproteobacteria bacterium]
MVRPLEYQHQTLPGLRGKAASIVENKNFIRFITALILINAVTIGMETYDGLMQRYGDLFHLFDYMVVAIFTVEIALKLYAYRLPFFKVGWNVFDFVIVAISLMPHSGGLAILRSLRILRLLRLITLVPQMRNVIGALFHAIPGMASVIGILFVIVYVFAVLGSQFFGQSDNEILSYYFADVSNSMYTMFQLMTLDDWTDVANETMQFYPWSWLYFIPFIVITSFAVLNLFIGVIVDALNIVKGEDLKEEDEDLRAEIRALGNKIDDLRAEIKRGQS